MSLQLFLDENISPIVAEQLRSRVPEITVDCAHTWNGGVLLSESDDVVLRSLSESGWLLVTYDVKMLSEHAYLFDGALPHAGVLFIDRKTVPPRDFGALVKSLAAFWEAHRDEDWSGRLGFLDRSPAR